MILKRQQIYKLILSIFVVFQLLAVFILPNPESNLYRSFHSVFGAYGNFLGFNTTWRFFSPNPLMRLMEYEVFFEQDGVYQSTSHRYPKVIEEERFRETYNRKLNHAMFMMMNPEALRELLGPKLCAEHPQAKEIAAYMRGREFPAIQKSKIMGIQDITLLGTVKRQLVTDIHCETDSPTQHDQESESEYEGD